MKPRGYADLHEHLEALDAAGLLVTVERPINKDTEMHPLVRWQFRGGIAEKDRKAFLFRNVIDAKGRKYEMPVVVGALAASREIYRIGMGCPLEQINETWTRAIAHPIKPAIVDKAPCQEMEVPGLDALPLPISTPGWDIAPYTTLSQYITKDPQTGIQNMGIYRGMLKAPRRLGMNPSVELRAGIYAHWLKYRKRGEKMPSPEYRIELAFPRPGAVSWVFHRRPQLNLTRKPAKALNGVPNSGGLKPELSAI